MQEVKKLKGVHKRVYDEIVSKNTSGPKKKVAKAKRWYYDRGPKGT